MSWQAALGKTLKHRSYFNVDIVQPSFISVLQYQQTPSGKRFWHHSYHAPKVNYSVIYANIGNNYTAGFALGSMIGITMHSKNNRLRYGINTGFAYLNKPFDIIKNRENNVIGSHINNVTQFTLAYHCNKGKMQFIEPFICFTHFSNGRFSSPNQGYNIVSIGFSSRFKVKSRQEVQPFHLDSIRFSKKIIPSIQAGMAWGESLTPNGPKFPAYIMGVFANKRITKNTSLFINSEMTYDTQESDFIHHAELTNPKFIHSFRNTIFIGAEVFVGNVSFKGKTGTDLIHAYQKRGFSISEVSLNYYIKDAQIHQHQNVSFGINLQTILFNAQHLGVSCSYQF